MITRTLQQVSEMIGAASLPEKHYAEMIQGVSIDTRSIKPHHLFIPIQGDRFNGHEFVREAFAKGAAAALWNRDEPGRPTDVPLIEVEDTLTAIQQLAKAYRSQLNVKVIGITGSNGKTSTKDILASLLATTYKTTKTIGNLNNHLGVPLTLLSMEEDTEMAVVEMGMSGLGEIEQLASLAQLDAAIITNVSEVHLGDLKTKERIVQAKLEILTGLKQNSLFVYNGDLPPLTNRVGKLSLDLETISFGESTSNTLFPTHFTLNEQGVTFTVSDPEGPSLFLPLLGKHQLMNALSAIACARYFGVSYNRIESGLLQVEATGMRTERIQVGNCTVINDTYKSNPTSLRAALDTLYALNPCHRKIVVLGDMVELGEESVEMHWEIGATLDPAQLDMVITIGSLAQHFAQAAAPQFPQGKVILCTEKGELIHLLKQFILDKCIILIKGSRVLQLEEVVAALQMEANAS